VSGRLRAALGAIRRGRLPATIAVGVLALAAAGCGEAARTQSSQRSTFAQGPQLTSESCQATSVKPGSGELRYCVFMLTDGRRFRCSATAFATATPTVEQLSRAKACVSLGPIAVPRAPAAAVASVARTRTCLLGRGFRVSGGAVAPQAGSGADGELTIRGQGASGLIGFFRDARSAERQESLVRGRAQGAGGLIEGRGAVMVLWVRPPAVAERAGVLACSSG
jgi:hypothetical protein